MIKREDCEWIEEIVRETVALREEYQNKVKSWGKSDADKWWHTQMCLLLTNK